MDYHYSDLSMPSEHITDPYVAEYGPQYTMTAQDAEYEVRSTVLVDGGDRFGVSAVAFDKFEELIWMGNQGGHVTSYYGPSMQKYTSFQIHATEEVRDILTLEDGVFALTKSTLRHQIRRGIPKHTFKSANMIDMQCLYQVGTNELLMGGHQNKIIDLDLTKMVEKVIPIEEEGCAVLRSGGSALFACGSANGMVSLRDLRTPNKVQHLFRAHNACLSDLDMHGDLLISCGFSQSAGGDAVAESYVTVWDVRRMKGGSVSEESAWTLPTASPPLLLHFLPAFSGRAVAMSGDGHVALLHVNSSTTEKPSVFQVETHSSQCTVMDVSASSQALVFGDQSGHLHLFSPQQNKEPVFNNFSRSTTFADPVQGVPFVSISDTTFRFSSVPLPPLTSGTKWFNELPEEFFKKKYRKPKPIDPEVLKTMKMQGPIGYAPNPGTFKRNQMPYIEDTLEDLTAKSSDSKANAQPVPKKYKKLDLRFVKHGNNEELEEYNKTGFPGIEATLPNSYCNPMLQVLYYTPLVKSTLLAHTCAKEFCLSCELGFLFRMLDTSAGSPCQASNFLRAFRTVPEAAALGLILPDRGSDLRLDLIALIQNWNRFILHQIHYEILETKRKEKEIAIMAQNANSSPQSRAGNTKMVPNMVTPQANGQFKDEYNYVELEFFGPTTEFVSEEFAREVDGNGDAEKPASENQELLTNNHPPKKEESEISKLFAIGRHQLNRCLKCNKEEERESAVLACALQYPSGARESETRGFVELLRSSLCARRSTPAWCERCDKFTPTTQRGRLFRLPPILAINFGGVSAHEKAYWAKGVHKDVVDSKRGGSGKPCRYGMHCARPGCRFKHPDRPSSSQTGSSKSPSQDSHCILPHQMIIRLQSDGDVIIQDKRESPPELNSSPGRSETNKHKKKHVTMQSEDEYTLSAAVVCVEDNPKNLVAYVHTANKNGDSNWYLFNDLSIEPVNQEEVLNFSAWWKSPCVLFYTSRTS